MNKFENSKTNSFKIPPVHKILNLPVAQQLIDRYGHLIVVNAVRDILAEYRYNQKKKQPPIFPQRTSHPNNEPTGRPAALLQ